MSHKLVSLHIGDVECYTRIDVDNLVADKDAEIAQLQAMLEERNKQVGELKEERRWRKFSEEKPKEKQWILVFVENPSKYGTYIELRRWDLGCKFDVEDQELYTKWMPLPSAPKEYK